MRNFVQARDNGANFTTQLGWRSLKLFHPDGRASPLLDHLPAADAWIGEHEVRIGSGRTAITARLVLARKRVETMERQHERLRHKASRKGSRTNPRTLRAAGFVMLLTPLSCAHAAAEEAVRLYRMRWQVELAFRRLKSLGAFDSLQANDPRLART